MSFRAVNEKYLVPGSQILMVLGIVALCQPWSLFLHRYAVALILIGLVGFMIAGKVPAEEKPQTGQRNAGAQH